jgi:site-specific recombinase XerD
MHRKPTLPISGRVVPAESTAFLYQEEFLNEMRVASEATADTYRSGLRLFADWLAVKSDLFSLASAWPLNPATVDTTAVMGFRAWLMSNRAGGTVVTYVSAVVSYFVFLESRDRLPAGIDLTKLQRQIRWRKNSQAQARNVVALDVARQYGIPAIIEYHRQMSIPAPDSYGRRLTALRNRAIVEVLFSTAARISEVAALSLAQVGSGQNEISIIGKGQRPRTLHLLPEAREAINAYLAERQDSERPLWISHSRNSNGKRLSATSIHNLIKAVVAEMDLDGEISAHDFRHYRATTLLRAGMPLEAVQEYLGHADISTTRSIYAPVLGAGLVSDWLKRLG